MKRITVSDETYEELYDLIVRLLEGGKVQSEDRKVLESVLRSYTNLNNVSSPKKNKAEGGQGQPKPTENRHADGVQNGNRPSANSGQPVQNRQPVQPNQQSYSNIQNGQRNGQQGGVQ